MDRSKIKNLISTGFEAVQGYIDAHPNDTKTHQTILLEALLNKSHRDIVKLLLTKTLVEPNDKDNEAIIYASTHGYGDIVKILLNDSRVNPGARDNMAIVKAVDSGYTAIVKILLDDPRVDPVAQNNRIIINAARMGYVDILEILLKNSKINPSARDNLAIINVSKIGYEDIVKMLLTDSRVNPSAQDNAAIIGAAGFGHRNIVKLLLADRRVDPSAQDNQAIFEAAAFGHKNIVEILLNDSIVNPSAQNNRTIIEASLKGYVEIVELLLNDPRDPAVDPGAQNNRAIILASYYNRKDVVKLLLNDHRVNPAAQNNKAFIDAARLEHKGVVKLLLRDIRVNPAGQDNKAIIEVSKTGHVNVIKLLLNDFRIDPGAQDDRAFKIVAERGYVETAELLLKDYRVSHHGVKSTNRAITNLIQKRKEIDLYYGLITEDDYYRGKPIKLLKMVFGLFHEDSNYRLMSRRINYIFNCLDEDEFNSIMNSDISCDDLSKILKCVKNIRFDISSTQYPFSSTDFNANANINVEHPRNLLVILKNVTDIEFVYRTILNRDYLLPLLIRTNIGNENLLTMYRKYNFNLPLEREYQLGDIIGTRSKHELYQYVFSGKYLPYVKHEKTKLWLELTPEERQFLEIFMFPTDYHKNYVSTLSKQDITYWKTYIYKGDYSMLNENLRTLAPLSSEMIDWYNAMNLNIINAPVINKRCILYRGIRADKFEPDWVVKSDSSDPFLKTGHDTITWNAFSSCASVREIADAFRHNMPCCLFVIIVPVGAVLLDITSIKNSEFEIVLPPYSILKYLGTTKNAGIEQSDVGAGAGTGCIILKYLGYEADDGSYYFESEEERNKTLEEEMLRYAPVV